MREPKLMVATGKKAVGKTYLTTQAIDSYLKNHTKKTRLKNKKIRLTGRKVLIYDVNMEYTQYKPISPKDIAKFSLQKKPEIRRVLPIDEENEKMMGIDGMVDVLNLILDNFRNGLLVLEDINRYLIDTRSKEIIGLLATNRHRDLDVIIHLQSLSAMTRRLWQNCSVVRFHFQNDDIDVYKNRVTNFDMFKIAQLLVNKQYKGGNQRFYCYVSADTSKITGQFSKMDFKRAIMDYIELYPTMLNRTQKRYSGKDSRKQAINSLMNDFMRYYGN